MIQQSALTSRGNGLLSAIITPDTSIQLSSEIAALHGIQSKSKKVNALWDTGASRTCISTGLANELNLPAISMTRVQGAGGVHNSRVFKVDLSISGRISIDNLEVTEFVDNNQFDVLIGMDVITKGDLTLTNANNVTVFSFRAPSIPPHNDYVLEINKKSASSSAIRKFNKSKRR